MDGIETSMDSCRRKSRKGDPNRAVGQSVVIQQARASFQLESSHGSQQWAKPRILLLLVSCDCCQQLWRLGATGTCSSTHLDARSLNTFCEDPNQSVRKMVPLGGPSGEPGLFCVQFPVVVGLQPYHSNSHESPCLSCPIFFAFFL